MDNIQGTVKMEVPFFQVPNNIFLQKLDVYKLTVYMYLCRCGNSRTAFPSYNDIAKKCGISRRKAISTVKELIEKELVFKSPRDNTSNIYFVKTNLDSAQHTLESSAQHTLASVPYAPESSAQHAPISARNAPKKEILKNTNTEKEILKNIYSSVINYLNKKANTNYRATTKKTKDLIRTKINEEFKLEDFYKVIDNKVTEWTGTDMEKYLRPETLFGNKFENYLNQKNSSKKTNSNKRVDQFNNYEQREYDYNDLEKKLLGWQNEGDN